jgi:hypothetical protein
VIAGCSNVSATTPAKAKERVTLLDFEMGFTIPRIGKSYFLGFGNSSLLGRTATQSRLPLQADRNSARTGRTLSITPSTPP